MTVSRSPVSVPSELVQLLAAHGYGGDGKMTIRTADDWHYECEFNSPENSVQVQVSFIYGRPNKPFPSDEVRRLLNDVISGRSVEALMRAPWVSAGDDDHLAAVRIRPRTAPRPSR